MPTPAARANAPRPRRLVATAVGALVLGAVLTQLLLPATARAAGAPTAPEVTFGIQPATGKGPDGRGYFDVEANVGARFTDHVAVTNYSAQPITLSLRPTDAINTPSGAFALQPATATAKSLATWLQLPPAANAVSLAPKATAVVPFVVAVPAGASPGDHAGGILATLQSSVTSPSGQNLKLLQSVGTRLFLRVSGPLHPRLSVGALDASYRGTPNPFADGSVDIRFRVTNTGNVALGGNQTVYVTGLFGTRTVAKELPTVQLLLPGYSLDERVRFPHSVFPELRMHAHVSITPLVIPGSVQPASGPFVAERSFWAVPWSLVAIVAALLIAVAVLVGRRRHRSAGGTGQGGPGNPQRPGGVPGGTAVAPPAPPAPSGRPSRDPSPTVEEPVASPGSFS